MHLWTESNTNALVDPIFYGDYDIKLETKINKWK